ncbi:hypothetical protein [Streptomyces sp. AA1529]|uniref:hypothetical protein n=1 Tax=Streptomyces sp. AA1529 TaxID=1203257 RepID=UPI00031866D5|nr:hypothetical protein [Streptomyces sp. AA1529]
MRGWSARGRALLLAALLSLLEAGGLVCTTGTAAAADGTATPAAYLAEQLRENPVHLSDQLPRTNPLSARSAFAEAAKRTGVPTYVLVLPGSGAARGKGLLAAVHDRLGEDGLYVLLGEDGGSPRIETFGVDVPARDAATATLFELPYDAGTLEVFRHFVDVLRSGDAARRAARGLEASRAGEEPDKLHTGRTDRENQSFLTGLLLSGVPVFLVATGWYIRRRRGGKGPRLRLLVPAAAGAAVVIGAGAPLVFDDTRSDADRPPTAADLRARTVRVAQGLRADPVYVDPLGAGLLSPAQLERLRGRVARLDVPVRVAVVPLVTADESAGDGARLAKRLHDRLHDRLGKDGDGLYVVADASERGELELVNYGARLDSAALREATEDLRFGGDGTQDSQDSEDAGLYRRLDGALRAVGRAPQAPPGRPYLEPSAADDAVTEDVLPSLYAGDFAPGLLMGVVGAAAAFGVTAAGLAAAGRIRTAIRPAPAVRGSGAGGTPSQLPARLPAGRLRRTARQELGELNDAFEAAPDRLPDAVRARVWDCLDAATLLLDQEGDNRVDADADAPTLAAGLALVRAGRALLERGAGPAARGTGKLRLCILDPLHGPASATGRLKLPGETGAARPRPLCAECRAALPTGGSRPARAAETVAARLLCLPVPGAGRSAPYEPYHRLPGPLAARGTGGSAELTADLIVRRVREQLGVH